jgi:hypothetical protein
MKFVKGRKTQLLALRTWRALKRGKGGDWGVGEGKNQSCAPCESLSLSLAMKIESKSE